MTNPSATGFVTATFNDTAPTPDAGTTPPRSVICTSSTLPPPILAFATSRSAAGRSPGRVSNTRTGSTATNPDRAPAETSVGAGVVAVVETVVEVFVVVFEPLGAGALVVVVTSATVVVVAAGAGATVMLITVVTKLSSLVARTVNQCLPVTDGTPVTLPVIASRLSPAGSAPAMIEYVGSGEPLAATPSS